MCSNKRYLTFLTFRKKTRKTSAATLRKNLEKIAKHSARLRMRKCHLTRSPSNQNLSFALTIQRKQLKIVFDEGDKGIDPALVVKRKGQKDIRLPKTSNVQSMEGVEFHTIFYLPNAPYLYLMLSQNMGEHGGVVPQYKRVRIPGF